MNWDIVQNWIVSIGGLIIAFLSFYLPWRLKRDEAKRKEQEEAAETKRKKEQDEFQNKVLAKLENGFKILAEKISILETQNLKLEEAFDKHIVKDQLKENFKRYTSDLASEIAENNASIPPSIKGAIRLWGELMGKFIQKFHYSPSRKGREGERVRMVQDNRKVILREFRSYLEREFGLIKIHPKTRKTVKFSELLREENVYGSFEALVHDLERNGLKDGELIQKFENQVDKFCYLLITAYATWNEFELKSYNEDAA